MKKIITTVLVLTAVFCVASCNKNNPVMHGDGTIIPRITEVSTKAPIVTAENFASLYGSFKMDIFNTVDYYDASGLVTGRHYVSDMTVNWAGPGTESSTGVYWISETPLRFWFQAPASLIENGGTKVVSTPDYQDETISFKYDNAAPKAADADGLYHDAEYQDDIVFAYNYKEWEKDVTDDYIDIAFKHALAAVKFVIYTDDDSFASDMLQLKNVSLKGVASGADFVFSPLATGDLFSVSSYRDTVTFRQALSNEDISRTASNATDYSSETAAKKVFMMIPQTLGTDAELELEVAHTNDTPDDTSDDFSIRTKVSIAGHTWKPGHVYKYKLQASANTESIRFNVTLENWTDVNINL